MTCLVFGTNRVEAETILAIKQAVVVTILRTHKSLASRPPLTTMSTIPFLAV